MPTCLGRLHARDRSGAATPIRGRWIPDTLCHYTDFWGLKGILEIGALWATYSQTLNDDSETEYGLEVMREYVANLPNQDTVERLAKAIGRLDERAFTCCFTNGATCSACGSQHRDWNLRKSVRKAMGVFQE